MDTQTSILQTINQTTNSILEAVQAGGGSLPDNVVTTDGEQTLTNKILDNTNILPDKVVTTDGEQTMENKNINMGTCELRGSFSGPHPIILRDNETDNWCWVSFSFKGQSTDKITLVDTYSIQEIHNKTFDDSNTFPDTLARVADVAPAFELWNFTSETHQKINFYAVVFPSKGVMILFGRFQYTSTGSTWDVFPAGTLYTNAESAGKIYVNSNSPVVYISIPNDASTPVQIYDSSTDQDNFPFLGVVSGWTSYTIDSSVATQLI